MPGCTALLAGCVLLVSPLPVAAGVPGGSPLPRVADGWPPAAACCRWVDVMDRSHNGRQPKANMEELDAALRQMADSLMPTPGACPPASPTPRSAAARLCLAATRRAATICLPLRGGCPLCGTGPNAALCAPPLPAFLHAALPLPPCCCRGARGADGGV